MTNGSRATRAGISRIVRHALPARHQGEELRDMPQREFTDSNGTRWLVWSTTPSAGSVLGTDMQKGWLTFESDDERRRLVPIPRDWEAAASDRMELYCKAAERVTRTTPMRGVARQLDPETSGPSVDD